MKKLFILLAIFTTVVTMAQSVGINADGSSANASAMLDVSSTTKGFLAPRMTAINKNAIETPATGLIVYQIDAPAGFYYYDGASWNLITTTTSGGVPYSGATSAVDLGAFDLTVNGINFGRGGGDIDSNTAIVKDGFGDNTTGTENTAIGWRALKYNVAGNNNTAIGSTTLYNNLGNQNTSIGSNALSFNETGNDNTAIGFLALNNNFTGSNNTAIGSGADVVQNSEVPLTNATAIGAGAIVTASNTIQLGNTAVTDVKVGYLTIGTGGGTSPYSTVFGYDAMANSTAASRSALAGNTAIGSETLYDNNLGYWNTAVGWGALYSNVDGNKNTGLGVDALLNNMNGNYNTALGVAALTLLEGGNYNTALGVEAFSQADEGDNNTAIGHRALHNTFRGYHNTGIGNQTDIYSDWDSNYASNSTAIGNGAVAVGSNSVQLGNTEVINVKTFGTITADAVTYPKAHGINGQVLGTTGSGTLVWTTPSTIATNVSGTVAIVNGGTGSTTQNFVDLTTAQTIAGVKTFSAGISGNVTGNATTATTATNVSGTVAIANGGTGSTTKNFVDLTTAQTIAGVKTFSADLTAHGLTVGTGAGAITTNTAVGLNTLSRNTTGSFNTGMGNNALFGLNMTGNYNSAFGSSALSNNVGGASNSAFGVNALISNVNGSQNIAVGGNALSSNNGSYNTAVGATALNGNTNGEGNTAIGVQALGALNSSTNTSYNTAIGMYALVHQTSGSNNTAIGYAASVPTLTASNQVRIGNTDVTYAGVQVAWTVTSDKRWKSNIQNSNLGLDFISKLRPVSYFRNNDESKKTEYGFIAQELEATLNNAGATNNGIISKDDKGMYSVRYNDLMAPMVKAIQEQQSLIELQQKQINDLKKLVESMIKK